MKIDYTKINVKDIGHLLVVGILLFVVAVLVMKFVAPLLGVILPTVFGGTLTLTDTLLFLILLTMVVRHK